AARLVHFGAGGDLADRLLGAGVVGHLKTLTESAAEHLSTARKSQERGPIAERPAGFKASLAPAQPEPGSACLRCISASMLSGVTAAMAACSLLPMPATTSPSPRSMAL